MNADASTLAAANPPSARAPWWEIPALAGRMLWRHWPPLVFWFFAMRLGYDLMRKASLWLAEHSVLLSYAAVALMIVVQLAATIAMFLSLRPSMPSLRSNPRNPLATPTALPDRNDWTHALSVALLPFFAYYATWGLLDGIRRDFYLNYFFGVSFDARERLFDILSARGLWIALLVSAAVRWFAKRQRARSDHLGWSLLVIACEAYWIFVGAAAIAALWSLWDDWWKGTVAYAAAESWWRNPFAFSLSLAPLRAVIDPLWLFVKTLASAMLLPLVWLAITAIVYGIDLRRRQSIDAADERLDSLAQRYQGLHLFWHKLIERFSAGWHSKGVPVVNSIRLVLRAGLPALLVLCLGWTLLDAIDAWGWPLLMQWLGPMDPMRSQMIAQPLLALVDGPLSLRPSLFTQILRVVLLAATFDRALARIRAR